MCAHACLRVRVAHSQHRFRNLFSQADETGETVNGMPLKMFLDNGCPLEYLRLDSQVDETAKVSSHPSHHAPASLLLSMPSPARPNRPCCCRQMTLVRTYGVRQDFPRDLCPLTLRQIQFTTFNELCILYRVRGSECACLHYLACAVSSARSIMHATQWAPSKRTGERPESVAPC